MWSVEFYRGSTHVTEPERAAFNAIVDAQFADVVRPFTPGPAVYTYWDYTQLRFPKNRGMRIDFILGSPALAQRVTHAEIVREERKGKAPSDHAPVLVELARNLSIAKLLHNAGLKDLRSRQQHRFEISVPDRGAL